MGKRNNRVKLKINLFTEVIICANIKYIDHEKLINKSFTPT
jgi:hypothetical protein